MHSRPDIRKVAVTSMAVGLVAAAAAYAAIVGVPVAARWLGLEETAAVATAPAPEGPPAAAIVAAEPEPPAPAPPAAAAPPPRAKAAPTPPARRAPSRPAPTARGAATTKPAAAASAARGTSSPAPKPEPSAPVAASAGAAAPAAPTGRLYQPTDVDVSPKITTRVEPQLPADLRGRRINDVVIVRVLVSQSGRPSRISLLRRSKAGPSLDDAVVAAVSEWKFSPARRQGSPVNSWYNIGVPLTSGN
jgi:protein TonB